MEDYLGKAASCSVMGNRCTALESSQAVESTKFSLFMVLRNLRDVLVGFTNHKKELYN